MTTTSAAMASLRAKLTWHDLKLGQGEPKQLSLVLVTSGMTGERSSRPDNSERSPVRVECDHVSILLSAWA